MEGNKYWEENRNQYYSVLKEDAIVERIKECRTVLDKLDTDYLWKIILRDADNWVAHIDAQWQDVYDDEKIKQLRILKLAANQIRNMREGYERELKIAQSALETRRNPDKVEKDYDPN